MNSVFDIQAIKCKHRKVEWNDNSYTKTALTQKYGCFISPKGWWYSR